MKKAQKIAEKIEALKAQLSQARAAEKCHAAAMTRHAWDRAMRNSGLLSQVAAGTLTSEDLEREFKALVDRASSQVNRTETE